MEFTGYFEAILVEKAHIQADKFKVTIPSLFNTRESKEKGENKIVENIDKNYIGNSDNTITEKSIESTTVIEALNHTDYHFQLKGDVFTMERSEGQTMDNFGDSGGIPLAPGPLTPHYHKWDKPHKMYNFIYENLNNVELPKGTKCYGFFINGENNPEKFAVVRIEGAVPLTKGKAPKYKK